MDLLHLEKIKAILPDMIIVAITALAFPEDRQRCFDAGMNDYLSKPFTREEIAVILQRYLLQPKVLS